MDNYIIYENGVAMNYKNLILALLQQCKNEGLTVSQTRFVLSEAMREVERQVNQTLLPS